VTSRATVVVTRRLPSVVEEELTRDFVPRADLVLFVTSADRPFSETPWTAITRTTPPR